MSPARKKRRSFQQIMEEESGRLLRARLPREWAVHGYAPDYGIDGVLEIFDYLQDGEESTETLGEFLFFQLKSVRECKPRKAIRASRMNVEKGPPAPDPGETFETNILTFQLETDLLLTIESMGHGVCVILFLACLDMEKVYFVNLTDLIDKVITPEDPDWRQKSSKAIHVPIANEIGAARNLLLLRFYARRPKLLALFSKLRYQAAELAYARDEVDIARWWAMAHHFADALLGLDVWRHMSVEAMSGAHDELERLRETLRVGPPEEETQVECLALWERLETIASVFEEIWREWGLPTPLGLLTSTP